MCDGEKVMEIKPGRPVTVKTMSRSYQTKSLIITAGPWTNRLLRPLGIELPLQVRGGWKPKGRCLREETLELDRLTFESRICHVLPDDLGQISVSHEPQCSSL